MFRISWQYRHLIVRLTWRDIEARYRGSFLGVAWAVFTPLLMLAVFTFVFAFVFQARWQGGTGGKAEFALILYSGLVVYGFFAECIVRPAGLLMENPTYVKKIVFPLEILPMMAFGSALFHAMLGVVALMLLYFFVFGIPPWTIILLPFAVMPLLLVCLAVMWLLSSFGVFLRDLRQASPVLTLLFLFMSPVFYPLSAVPEQVRFLIYLNPITIIIEDVRRLLFWGQQPQWEIVAIYGLGAWLACWFSYWWFIRTRKAFADVI